VSEGRIFALVVFGLAAFAVVASRQPLAAYTLSLGFFGLPHVLSELRYVDRRFGRTLRNRRGAIIAALLAAIVLGRVAGVVGWLSPNAGVPFELACAALLALVCAEGPIVRRGVAALCGAGIGAATLVSPFETMVVFSILHNFTPLGFLWQLAPRELRPWAVAFAGAAFFVLPLAVFLHAPAALFGAPGPGLDPLGAGPLAQHLGVYVPSRWLYGVEARDFFAACVAAQGAHYASVILLLPLLLARVEPQARGFVAWPPARVFFPLIGLAGGIAFFGFAHDFAEARPLYGIMAALHAWIEIPILILALTPTEAVSSASPTKSEPALATSETSSARLNPSAAIQATSPASINTTRLSNTTSDGQ
jgi:hypothetical protein